jgi:hypothetical protein
MATITATVMKPTVENGAWVNRPFVLTVTPSGITDKRAHAEAETKAARK